MHSSLPAKAGGPFELKGALASDGHFELLTPTYWPGLHKGFGTPDAQGQGMD